MTNTPLHRAKKIDSDEKFTAKYPYRGWSNSTLDDIKVIGTKE